MWEKGWKKHFKEKRNRGERGMLARDRMNRKDSWRIKRGPKGNAAGKQKLKRKRKQIEQRMNEKMREIKY